MKKLKYNGAAGARKNNSGCANCAHYIGNQPANVPNFACGAGVDMFKVFFCDEFLRK